MNATGLTIVEELRSRLTDSQPTVQAMTVGCVDDNATTALLEIVQRRLVLTVAGGAVRPIDVSLVSAPYDTVGSLFDLLANHSGLSVQKGDSTSDDHPAADLQGGGPWDIRSGGAGVVLKHRYYSDELLERMVKQAIGRHNPSLRITQIPPNEFELILTLAQAAAIRHRANDVIRRKGTSADFQNLMSLSDALERTYSGDAARLQRAIQPVPEARPSTVGHGDVVMGHFTRQSLRKGYQAPAAVATPMPSPNLIEPEDDDLQDTQLRARWMRDPHPMIATYELWIDTQPEVKRYMDQVIPTTSTLAWKAYTPQLTSDVDRFSVFVESGQHGNTRLVVMNLEPETDYYMRIYSVDRNEQVVGGEVRKYRTKPLRTKFDPLNLPPRTATMGNTLTFRFTGGAFTANHELWIGGKKVAATLVSATEATAVVPTFVNYAVAKDIVVVSPSGLKDVRQQHLTVAP